MNETIVSVRKYISICIKGYLVIALLQFSCFIKQIFYLIILIVSII